MKGVKFSTASINLSKIMKDHLFIGKTGDKYLNLVIWHNESPDQYGNDGALQQSVPKELREQGVKAPYLGNYKHYKSGATTLTKEEQNDLGF